MRGDRRPSRWALISAVSGALIFGLYVLLIPFTTFTDTCTMGGKGLLPELIFGAPLAATAAGLFALAGGARTSSIRRVVVVSTGFFLFYLAPQILNVSLLGHHYCGQDYDYYLQFESHSSRWLPLVQLLLLSTVGAVALRPWMWRARGLAFGQMFLWLAVTPLLIWATMIATIFGLAFLEGY